MRKARPSLKDTKVNVARQPDIDHRLIKALSHPLRMRVLMRLNLGVASPVELARELEEPLANVAYHTRVLLDLGCVELVRTEHRRGAVEHYYRAVVRPYFSDSDWAQLPPSARQSISEAVLQRIWSDAADALRSGAFDARDDRHLSRTPLVLDERGWRELNELLADLLERALQLEAQSAGRRQEADEGEVLSSLVLIHHPRAPARRAGT
jgi:DNA-binding transcriptional ArsR family regulator